MSAPNLLRVGTPVNIFVECQDCTGDNNITVEIIVVNYPTKTKRLTSTSVTLTREKKFQDFGQITIPAGEFSQDPNIKQYVYLQAQFPDVKLEKLVLVSFQSGYIYIQTDKTLYTPNSKVHYRMFAVTPAMEPVERNNETDASIAIEIVTPEGIILPLDPVYLKSGMHSGVHKLNEIVSYGLWKVVARFHSKPQLSYSAEFEVKEYVLPSFEVKLKVENPFFYVDSQELTVNIKATYLFGEDVDGMAYGVFGVMHGGQKNSFPSSLQRVPIKGGNGVVTLKREHITQTFQNINDLVGSYIFVAAGVLTENGSEMVEAELRGIQIVKSPYTIHFKRTSRYFKPGMSFDVVIEVVHPDSTPVQGVVVVVDPGNVQGRTSANGMARLSINTYKNPEPLRVTAKTKDPRISSERQASANMTAISYSTNSNNYLHIGVDTAEVTLGANLKISLNLNRQESTEKDITYLILSRGQLVKYGHYRNTGQVLISMIVTITKNMLPSFRIIAYYHPNDNEVVSDSVWVDAEDSCMGSLKLEPERPHSSYEPRKMFTLKVTGDPGATVGLVAVDKGVYVLNNKHRLNQKKVWDMIETYDTGCTPGGGKDGMGVFYDAGLLFESNTASGTPYRQELNCPVPSRRKRAATIMDVTTTLASQYEDQLQRDCCLDGMRNTPLTYTCERRAEYISDGADCAAAFLHCCKEMEAQRAEMKEDSLLLARSEEDDSYLDSNEIVSRTKFPESWLWTDMKLPPCPEIKPNCDTTSLMKNVPLQDSITTWQFTGISLSRTHGICVAEPLEVIVRKNFFIDLRLPYSAVRGEQLEVKAVLHNYSPNPVTVRVDLMDVPHVCSAASKRGNYRQEVKVGPQATKSVPFIIIPTKEGQYHIEVKASVKDPAVNDGIIKMLQVVGDVHGRDSDASMTAFCLIAIQESRTQCAATVNSLQGSIDRAVAYLEKRLPSLINPYAVVMASYALANENKLNQEILFKFASPELSHWPTPMGRVYTLEATAYALLALVKAKATIIVYQAIAEYWTSAKEPEYDLNVDIFLPGRSKPDKYNFNNDNHYATRTSKLSKGRARTISKYTVNPAQSERSSVIIYLDKVSHTQPEEITFRIHQKLKVGVLQPAAVSVYEYNNHQSSNQTHCVKFYHPERRGGQLLRLCRNDQCECAEENCSMQKKGNVSNDQRTAKACETQVNSKIDFVYKVRLDNFTDGLSTDIYTVQVLEVIKEGSNDVGPMGKQRTFLSYRHCRAALDLRTGKTYLIMGASKDIYRDARSESYQYVLAERTWIEYWPTDVECKTAEYNPVCAGMSEMVQQYTQHGCQQ
ncbi:hypothetical protein EPR50_G00014440 [Perca flavescens]|uniref:Anaphylatoxin-like domain-containing protein n=1 Tax=Perca flavescens TaxID=8167 RepID=A0A484DK74_PERFV|nr:hypothetical protein EPR50_G00014440 [Perca flavescens]